MVIIIKVGVYSPGGHYLPHHDDFEVLDPQSMTHDGTWVGNRVATVMVYLSDVQAGYTAFPSLKIAAKPKKVRKSQRLNKYSNNVCSGQYCVLA